MPQQPSASCSFVRGRASADLARSRGPAMTQGIDINLKSAPGVARPAGSSSQAVLATLADPRRAGLPVGDLQVKKQRSLWGDAWRQFRKHKLAMAGLVVFAFMLLATFVGSPLYPQEIDVIDFSVSGSG